MKLFFIGCFLLLLMSIARIVFLFYYNPNLNLLNFDVIKSIWMGVRLDLTVVGYSFIPIYFLLLFSYFFKKDFTTIFKYYYYFIFLVIITLIGSDFGFYSYFKEHINILFFGLFDDDTTALLKTFWQNYHVIWILIGFIFIYLVGLFFINKIFSIKKQTKTFFVLHSPSATFLILFVVIFLISRGTLGMYPLGKMLPNISKDKFFNSLCQNSVRSFIRAYKIRKNFFKNKYDLIQEMGFNGKIEEAFKIHTGRSKLDKNLLKNITYKTRTTKDGLNVVVVMVESFGMPILKYNSNEFDLLRSMKKHFKNDILFKHFISAGDGTIPSLEALLLNITHRPNTFPFSQSPYKNTNFSFAPAFLYKSKGYETTFVYGGDLSWRDVGNFVKYQGFKNVFGKIDIYDSVKLKDKNLDYFHPWGVYDEFLFKMIEKKLSSSKTPQFIFALTTNNHPPYNIPKQYHSKILHFSKKLKNHLTGDLDLAKQRFYSYQYAIDQVGKFLDWLENSKYKDNTVVAITADNNTIDGIMTYDKDKLFNSKNIPFLLYLPKSLKQKYSNKKLDIYGSHKDIFPTLYNLTLSNTNYISIGKDLLHSKENYGFNGSGVVASRYGTINYKDIDNDASRYYKATLSVEEYLLRFYEKRENEK